MKLETIEKANKICNNIKYAEYELNQLIREHSELKQRGYMKIGSDFQIDIKIPSEYFQKWFSEYEFEIKKRIHDLEIELENL